MSKNNVAEKDQKRGLLIGLTIECSTCSNWEDEPRCLFTVSDDKERTCLTPWLSLQASSPEINNKTFYKHNIMP